MDKLKKFIIDLKNIIRNSGRSFINIADIDFLFIKHNINVKDLEDGKTK